MTGITLKRQYGDYTIARLPVLSPIPSWCEGAGFVSVSRGDDELSVICLKTRVPARVTSEGEWVCFKCDAEPSRKETSPVHSVIRPVLENGIEVFVVSTFGGDYIFMPTHDAALSIDCLTAAGHHIA